MKEIAINSASSLQGAGGLLMTTAEIAKALGASVDKVTRSAKELFPTRMKQGKSVYWTEAEATAIKYNFRKTAEVAAMPKTRLEKEMVILQAMAFQKEIIEELEQENASLRQDNTRLQIKADTHETYLTVKRVAKLNDIPWSSLDWKRVKRSSHAMELDWQKADDLNYGKCNAYHIDAWRDAYPSLNYGVVL